MLIDPSPCPTNIIKMVSWLGNQVAWNCLGIEYYCRIEYYFESVRGFFTVGHFAVKKMLVPVRLGQIRLDLVRFFLLTPN